MEKSTVKKLNLEGLSCTACETKIESTLLKLDGVSEAVVSYKLSTLVVTFDESKISLNRIIKEVEKLDYTVLKQADKIQGNHKGTEEKKGKGYLACFIVLMGVLYLVNKSTGIFNFIPEVNANMGYGILFVVGLLSSLHCIAMCGGINLSLSVSYKQNKDTGVLLSKFLPGLLYNTGRVISYTIIGGIIGAIGSVFTISNTGTAFITAVAGIFMIIMGLNMLNIFPWLRRLNPHMPKFIAKKINKGKYNKGPLVVGLLNGLMPCGPLQAMQLYALGTGSFLTGALSMFVFSLGTVPLLLAFSVVGTFLSSKAAKKMMLASGMLVMILGFVMLNRGFAFTGFTVESFASELLGGGTKSAGSSGNTAKISGNSQELKTTLQSGQYPAITVTAGIPVKWTITADKKSLNGCNNQIIIPKYGIKQKLKEGDNIITFTPDATGTFAYSCWMGMIRSTITVVDKNGTTSSTSNNAVDNTGIPAGCCGGGGIN